MFNVLHHKLATTVFLSLVLIAAPALAESTVILFGTKANCQVGATCAAGTQSQAPQSHGGSGPRVWTQHHPTYSVQATAARTTK